MNILELLNPYIDSNYRLFQLKICPTKYEILGVKIPILRKMATKLLKEYDYQFLINSLNNNYFEEIMLKGLIIAKCKTSLTEKLQLIDNFLPLIDNWAVCDIFCGELKIVKNNQDYFLNYLDKLKRSNHPYYLRFILVILLNYYIDTKYLNTTYNYILAIQNDDYYVKMAKSWCISICLIKYFNETINFLNANKNKIDKWTYNKALQKGIESYRITTDNKIILKNMKLK